MNKTFRINVTTTNNGLSFRTPKGIFRLVYPENIWRSYPRSLKDILKDNLSFLLTMDFPLVSGVESVKYNTNTPFFMPFFFNIALRSIPWAIADYQFDTQDVIKQFLNTRFHFNDGAIRIPSYQSGYASRPKAIVPLSFGKDSLLTLALAMDLGLEPVCVYINDTVSPKENKIKLKMVRKISKEFGLKAHVITNQIEKLNDFELWKRDESCLGYMHMVTGFSFMLLPLARFYKAKYILIGNQQDMNFELKNKDGYLTSASPDQYWKWTRLKSRAIFLMSGGATQVSSIIEPLTNIAIVKLLHSSYPQFGKYQISCDSLYSSEESRWCHSCSKCARLSLFMKAVGADIEKAGFKRSLLDKRHRKLYSLFEGKEVDIYESSEAAKRQQLLAFYLAYQRGERGALMEEFRSQFLNIAQKQKNSLKKEFFGIYNTELPSPLKNKLNRLLRNLI